MQRKQGLVAVAKVLADLPGLVAAIRNAMLQG